jgi:hypothetical protein
LHSPVKDEVVDTLDQEKPLYAEEAIEVEQARLLRLPADCTLPADYRIGLAISGGGIRSATFALGILEHLHAIGLLRCVDYLSTVSGGGYIGSWLATAIQRGRIDLSDPKKPFDADLIQHLRGFSNYLAPRASLSSLDSWTIATIWLRNTVLVQAQLFLLLSCALLLALAISWGFHLELPYEIGRGFLGFALVSLLGAAVTTRHCLRQKQKSLESYVVVFVMLAAMLQSLGAWQISHHLSRLDLFWLSPLLALLGVGFAILLERASYDKAMPENQKGQFGWRAATCLITGVVFGAFCSLLQYVAIYWHEELLQDPESFLHKAADWHAAVLGTPLILFAHSLLVTLLIGLMGRHMSDGVREWWSRIGAQLAMYAAGLMVLQLTAVYGPLALAWVRVHVSAALANTLTVGWLVTTLAGIMAASSDRTGDEEKNRSRLNRIAVLAPWVFLIGMLCFAAWVNMQLLAQLVDTQALAREPVWLAYEQPRLISGELLLAIWPKLYFHTPWFAPLLLIFVLTALLAYLSFRVDVNEFSLNHFYRNRLVRCYIGGSRKDRHGDTYQGFDFDDDIRLSEFRQDKAPYAGPYPIVNTALNLGSSSDLDQQERQATNFIFTPRRCGTFSLRSDQCGAVWSDSYLSGAQLGTAMAISGAAASPNSGYHTAPLAALLLTVFNVRLGWWVPSPRRDNNKNHWRRSPLFGLYYLLAELFGAANARREFLYLSDGGHFENLATYELLRRRCSLIIICDGEQDEKYQFDGLARLIRLARKDLNAEIDIDVSAIRNTGDTLSRQHVAVGTVTYRFDGKEQKGSLIYLKLSLTGDEPRDLLGYADQHPQFPHQSTGDQFFSESQFESYRELGRHAAEHAFQPVAGQLQNLDENKLTKLLWRMRSFWMAPAPSRDQFTRHTHTLTRLWHELREDPSLSFLDAQIFPQWNELVAAIPGREAAAASTHNWLPRTERQMRRSFFYLCAVIQLMEDVYTDLNLGENHSHPDNGGWINLFRQWAYCGMFRVVWFQMRGTFGARFRTWCETYLGLDVDEKHMIFVRPITLDDLNGYERRRLAAKGEEEGDVIYGFFLRTANPVENESQEFYDYRFGCARVNQSDPSRRFLRVQNHLRGMWLSSMATRKLEEAIGRSQSMRFTSTELQQQPIEDR